MVKINIKPELSLAGKVVKGSIWLLGFQILDNGLGLTRLIILARFLSPRDFGLVGIAWLVLQILGAFTQTGIHQALIQAKSIENKLDTAWTYLALRGAILFSIVWLLASPLANFMNSPTSAPIIQVIAITLLFEGFSNIGVVLFQREFEFNKQFILQIAGNAFDALTAITLAFYLRNAWAIVYGALAGNVVRFALSYILSSYRPKFELNFKVLKEMNNFGKWIFGSTVLQFLYSQGDDILVGKVLGPLYLGYYQLAYKISNLPTTQITSIISTVLFPAYAKIQADEERLKNVYLTSLELISFLSFLLGTYIIYFARDFIYLFLGAKWLPILLPMQILTVWGLLRSLGATSGPLWQAIGKPKIVTNIQLVQTVIFALSIYPLTMMYGISGTAISVVGSAFLANIITFISVSKTIKLKPLHLFHTFLYPIVLSIVILLIQIPLKSYVFTQVSIFSFMLEAILIAVIYLVFVIMLTKVFKYPLISNISKILQDAPLPNSLKPKITSFLGYLQ